MAVLRNVNTFIVRLVAHRAGRVRKQPYVRVECLNLLGIHKHVLAFAVVVAVVVIEVVVVVVESERVSLLH